MPPSNTAAKKKPAAEAAATAEVYIATQSGVCELDGEALIFVKGRTRVQAGHPLLDAVPDYFMPASEKVHYEVHPQ